MRRSGALFLALLLAGCGGGGGSHAALPATATAAKAKGAGNVQFSIKVPAASQAPQAKNRKPQYVSPATQSFSVAVAGTTTNVDVTNGSPGCATDYTQPAFSETNVGAQPRGVVKGPDGNIWFVEDDGYEIGNIAPGGIFTNYSFGYFGNGIIVGPDSDLWTTSPYNALLGHIMTNGTVGTFTGYPYDMQYLAVAADGTVWGTAYTQGPGNVVYHVAADGSFIPADTITMAEGSNVVMPALGADGAIYVTEYNGTSGWVARIAKVGSTWSLTNEFPLPGVPYAITNGPDNALWVTDYTGHVYRMTTSGTITNTYTLTPGASVAIHTLPDGALWIAEYGANKIARLTTTGTLNEFPAPSPSTNPYDVAQGSDGIYFSEQNANKIARMNFPVACTSSATLPSGNATATVTAYDATGGAGGGHVLSTQTLAVNVLANTTTVVNFVLNGVVQNVTVTANASPGCSSSGTIPLIVEATDPAGNAIVGPGTYSDAAGDPLTLALTTSDASGHTTFTNGAITAPSATAAVNWTGGVMNYQTIGITPSGGTVPGTITPLAIGNNC